MSTVWSAVLLSAREVSVTLHRSFLSSHGFVELHSTGDARRRFEFADVLKDSHLIAAHAHAIV